MDTILIFSIFFFIFSFLCFFSNTFAMDNECSISKCGDDHVVVKYPFRITQNQHPNCGYPGFDLSCTSFGKTVIQLPSSGGEFYVSEIDYVKQEIRIHDRANCLPKRLLTLNLSESPFQGIELQDYTFLNCSSNYTTTKISPISCLSSSMNKVFATSSLELAGILSTRCEIIDNIKVPIVPQQLQNETKGYSSELDNDLILTWKEPKCSKCDQPGWGCKTSIDDGNYIGCMHADQNDSTKNVPSIYNDGKDSFKMALAETTTTTMETPQF
ncbi:putative RING-H2 finger protein ATL21A isoform X3 [Papaver somniferum]|uniref:putative RING-H2 finger protein ATL21A isoform X3 n=1 Tax=Papaver somniferum TaxID=3469 RepID=UPI000E705F0F|nr:putative RING-H2 finger protein ATL21A isoform X3 [Papaver somniferum]